MNIGNDKIMANGLCVSVDWLSFTIKKIMTWQDVISHFGMNLNEFQFDLKGALGYKCRARHMIYPVSVLYDGNDNMGLHVTVSGSAVRYFLDCYLSKHTSCKTPFGGVAYEVDEFDVTVLRDVLKDIMDMGQLSRLDLAIDDKGCRYYTMDDVFHTFYHNQYISKFKTYTVNFKGSKSGSLGGTLSLGSRSSAVFIRIYDKEKEQNSKKANTVTFPWVRWELELHKERANVVAAMIVAGSDLPSCAIGILSQYLRFIVKDNARDTRCSTDPRWESFLDGIKKMRVCQPKVEKTLDDKRDWFKKQVAPTMAAIYEIDGDLSFFYSLIESGSLRYSVELQNMILKYQNEMLDDVG